jgi:hypothetical protein
MNMPQSVSLSFFVVVTDLLALLFSFKIPDVDAIHAKNNNRRLCCTFLLM